MAITAERIDPADPLAVELATTMWDEVSSIYGRDRGPAISADPHELAAFLLIRKDDRVVAGGALKPLSRDVVEIKRMYVVPEARSRGHARRLLEALEAAAREDGWARVRLDTGPSQPHARALYESAGYREIADYNGNPYAAYWAEKDLPALVPARFNGPPGSGHGGYSAWVASRYVDAAAVEVRLRKPPPLEQPMEVLREGGTVLVSDVLEARPAALDIAAPAFLAPGDAARHVDPSLWAQETHPFPTCFACGPLRDDGLRLFPGPVGDGRFATDWTAVADPAMVWAALDCPSCAPLFGGRTSPIVLASFTVQLHSLPDAQPHTIVSEMVEQDGRKHTAVVALYAADGELRALGRALWIELRPR